jgi:hypothetical protein
VRKLAENTKNASESIGRIMGMLQGEASRMLEDSEQMHEIANSSQGVIGQLEQKFGQFYESAITTLSGARYAQDLSFASLVKVDHVIYKQRAYVLVSEPEHDDFVKAVGVDHHTCRLGKWYEGPGKEVFGGMPSFKHLDAPHGKVHECMHGMLDLLGQGWERDEAVQERIYGALKCAEGASLEVMQLIDRLVIEKHPDGKTA